MQVLKRLRSHTTPTNLKSIEQEIETVKRKDAAVHAQNLKMQPTLEINNLN